LQRDTFKIVFNSKNFKLMDKKQVPWGEIGYITFKRTYARRIDENDINSRTEEFDEVITRELRASDEQLGVGFTDEEKKRYFETRMGLKWSPAGRFMWQLGTKTVEKLGLPSLQNCAFTTVNEPIRPFTWTMDMLMLGSGVGFNIQRENVYKLPILKAPIEIKRVDEKDVDFIVPDNREGWIKLLGKVLKAHFYSGKGFTYSAVCVRGKGAPIKGFGGISSGPEELCWGINEIHKILNKKAGKKLEPIDCLDIMNIIGFIVVSGNVRRSAEIAIGDYDDLAFLRAKNWSLGNIPNWRAMSNNSIITPKDLKDLPKEFWETYEQGEPYGMINLRLAKKVGRTGEKQYKDADIEGFNPSLRAGTKVWTSEGIVPIELLQDKKFVVKNLRGESVEAECWLSGKGKQLYKIVLSNGFEYYCTPEHKWPISTPQGYVKCETTDLRPGHLLPIIKRSSLEVGSLGNYEDGFAVGWLYGDGWVTTSPDGKNQYGWIVSKEDQEHGVHLKLMKFFERVTGNCSKGTLSKIGNIEWNLVSDKLNQLLLSFGVEHKSKGLPTKIWTELSEEFRRGFIDAFLSADGFVDPKYANARIAISQSNFKLLEDLGELLGFYGIKTTSHTHTTKIGESSFPNGKDYNKEYHRKTLMISNRDSIDHFKSIFTLTRSDKQAKIEEISFSGKPAKLAVNHQIVSVELTDLYEDVWDISVKDDTHCFQLSHVITGNCGEQSLEPYETCCLAEIFLPNINSPEELQEVLTYAYRMCKHSLTLPCHLKETEDVVHKNMRMGIGMTGVLQATEEQRSWLKEAYVWLREYDKQYSANHKFPTSIKLTTIKPSGTSSLIAGVTPGVHPNPAGPYYIRRVRIAADSPLVEVCRQHGYEIESQIKFDGELDRNTVVVSFPCAIPESTPIAATTTWKDQLDAVRRMQAEWSDNSVSCTVYYKKEDLPEIKEYLDKYFANEIKSVSFLLYQGHGFVQAPYESVSKERYLEMKAKTRPILTTDVEEEAFELDECSSGACPIR
jgi:ribonucleotide reductase alpha subunit